MRKEEAAAFAASLVWHIRGGKRLLATPGSTLGGNGMCNVIAFCIAYAKMFLSH